MKKFTLLLTSLGILALVGCGKADAEFDANVEINDVDAGGVFFPIFGATVVDNEGVLALIVSSDPALCDEEINGNFEKFSDDLAEGNINSDVLVAQIITPNDLPKDGDVINGNGDNAITSFFSADANGLNVLAIDDGGVKFTVDQFVNEKKLSGNLETTFIFEDVTQEAIDVDINGSFVNADHCQAITDFLAEGL